MRMRISRIFQLAIVDGKAEMDPAAPLAGIIKPVRHRRMKAIIDLQQARDALRLFEAEPHWPSTLLASRLTALTASRFGPVRQAKREEFIDLGGSSPRWVIPAGKLKLERAQAEDPTFNFTIPLSRQAVQVVQAAIAFSGSSPWLFPQPQTAQKPMSENAVSVAYRRCPAFTGRHVPHGWRSTFSTIMNERASDLERPGDREVIDLMLAHKPSGAEAAYNRSAYMRRRRELAQEWADLLCDGLVEPAALLEGPRHW